MTRAVTLHLALEKFVDFPPDVLPEKDVPPPDSQGTLPLPDEDQTSCFYLLLSVETKPRMRSMATRSTASTNQSEEAHS